MEAHNRKKLVLYAQLHIPYKFVRTEQFLRNLSLIRCGKLKSEAINKALLTSSCEETADFESKKLQPNGQCCAILDVAISMIYC